MSELADHTGAWEGSWRTFLRPDELYDESPVRATIERDGDGYVIEYSGSIQGDAVTGRLRWTDDGDSTSVDWVDSWHTGGKQERLTGPAGSPPSYEYGDEHPWTWDITIDASAEGVAVIHHNSGPGVPRYVGVMMKLEARDG